MVAVPVVAVVGQSCVQALRTSWALWRLAGALPRQVLAAVVATVAALGPVVCVPGMLLAPALIPGLLRLRRAAGYLEFTEAVRSDSASPCADFR